MRIEPEISGVAIVMVGSFNPAIFTPAWFALHGLLSEKVAENAELEVAHNQVTLFSADWLTLQATTERFSAATGQAPYVRLRDLVVRIFKEFLPHTPATHLGVNRQVHFTVRNAAERDRIGRALAPIQPWGKWGERIQQGSERGGMTSLTMSQIAPKGREKTDQINVTVEPSTRVGEGHLGIYVSVNDHFAIDAAEPGSAERLMELFGKEFDASLKRSETIIDQVMSLART
ncbi:MAG: hypothetical protein OXG29_12200 [Gammaproteobacteria bacterium]|nr:hypothetical protein [Gammaproteobacteria bacterium]